MEEARAPARAVGGGRYAGRVLEMSRQFLEKNGRQPLACIRTYGCQQNESDSERLAGMLAAMGYGFTQEPTLAEFVLFNTCAVREHAEMRVFGNLGALRPAWEKRRSMVIALCGCMVQQEHIAQKLRESYPFVDLVFGTHMLSRLPELLWRVLSGERRVCELGGGDGDMEEGLPVRREGKLKAWLPVMRGCDNFCSYCIVPYVRGRERSREPETILREAEKLIAEGYREITLLGQNVNSYGRGLPSGVDFPRLLRAVCALPGDFRVRFMTSHPKDASPALFAAMAESPKAAKHLHLPFQAGNDRVLRLMNRRYTRERYLSLVRLARESMPGLSLTSDVIVGFPGETYEEFRETLGVLREVRFDNLFTFIYSKRRGTPAEKLEDPVSHAEKAKWLAELLNLQEEILRERLASFSGQTLRVLYEERGDDGLCVGRADNNLLVRFSAEPDAVGRFVNVRVTGAGGTSLTGTAVADGPSS